MAWISVHEDVIGPKLRHLTKLAECSRNEALGCLITLWLWGIKNADQTGCIKSAEKEDVADVISSGLTEGLDPVKVVESMVESGWIDEVNGKLYLHDWGEWQELWYKYLGRKEKDTARKRLERDKDTPPALPPEAPALPAAPPAPKKPKKEPPKKNRYAELVHMTEGEHKKLVSDYGEAAANKFVEVLDLYKGSKGKTYKDDYRAILMWVVEKVKREHPGLIKAVEAPADENPFADWGEKDG